MAAGRLLLITLIAGPIGLWHCAFAVRWKVRLKDTITVVEPTTTQPRPTTPVQLVDWREWKQLQNTNDFPKNGPLMLIVDTGASNLPEAEGNSNEDYHVPVEEVLSSTASAGPTTTSSSSTSSTTTSTAEPSTDSTTVENEKEAKKSDVTVDFKNLPNILNVLKQLSLIPTVVRAFTSQTGALTPSQAASAPVSFASSSDVRYASDSVLKSHALSPNLGYSAQSPSFVTASPSEAEIPRTLFGKRAELPNMPAPIIPINSNSEYRPREVMNNMERMNRLNIFGIEATPTTVPRAFEAPTTSPPRQRPQFDFSQLTKDDVMKLESIHRKLFHKPGESAATLRIMTVTPTSSTSEASSEPPIFLFKKPKDVDSAEKAHNHEHEHEHDHDHDHDHHVHLDVHNNENVELTADMLHELELVKDLPDLEELTKGMDLSLLNRPGGFAKLKQQFMERLVEKTLASRRRFVHRMN